MYLSVEWVIIDTGNGLSPNRWQAITWTNADILSIGPFGTNFKEVWIKIQYFSFNKIYSKVPFVKWQPFCSGLNVLNAIWCVSVTWISPINQFNLKRDNYKSNHVIHGSQQPGDVNPGLKLRLKYNSQTWSKWPTFCKQHFQMHFVERKLLHFDSNFIEVCF